MNTLLLADAQTVFLLSVYKPILFGVTLGAWAWVVSWLDKDLRDNHLPRELWNLAQVGAGIVMFGLWLLMPFWLGLPLTVLVTGGVIAAYVFWRNANVETDAKWDLSTARLAKPMDNIQQARANKAATVQLLNASGGELPVPKEGEPAHGAHQSLETLLGFVIPYRAERFELHTDGKQTTVTVLVDGVKYPQEALDAQAGLAMIDYIKTAAAMDVADRRRKQAGRMTFIAPEGRHTIDVVTQGSTRGLSLMGELDSVGRRGIPFDKLGLLESQKQQLVPVLDQPGRVVLVAAPPGQGMTTTLYALLGRHDAYTQNLVVIEEQHEHELEGVKQDLIPPGASAEEFNQKIKTHALRESQAILLSRVPDASTAAAVAEWAKETRFYVGVRHDDALATLRGWVKAVGDPKKAAASLAAVISQRLVRRLCTNCRVAYKPDPQALQRMNLPADKVSQFYKHSGQLMVRDKPQTCPVCQGLGYKGRVAVFEVMALNDEARELIATGQLDQLRATLRRHKLLLLQEAALMKVVAGETSIGEVSQATREKKP